jgi:hypothetical protein
MHVQKDGAKPMSIAESILGAVELEKITQCAHGVDAEGFGKHSDRLDGRQKGNSAHLPGGRVQSFKARLCTMASFLRCHLAGAESSSGPRQALQGSRVLPKYRSGETSGNQASHGFPSFISSCSVALHSIGLSANCKVQVKKVKSCKVLSHPHVHTQL